MTFCRREADSTQKESTHTYICLPKGVANGEGVSQRREMTTTSMPRGRRRKAVSIQVILSGAVSAAIDGSVMDSIAK